MKIKQLKSKVQKAINKKVAKNSKHFSQEPMDRQIEALIEVVVENFIQKDKKKRVTVEEEK